MRRDWIEFSIFHKSFFVQFKQTNHIHFFLYFEKEANHSEFSILFSNPIGQNWEKREIEKWCAKIG